MQDKQTKSIIAEFQEKLTPIKESFDKLLKEYGVKNNISIMVQDGKVIAHINVDELY